MSERLSSVVATLRALALPRLHLTNDSRHLARGDVFVAYPGARTDGRNFVAAAFESGAAAAIVEEAGWPEFAASQSVLSGPIFPVRDLARGLGALSAEIHGHPSERLHLIGVTGTNGKTSTTQWMAQALTLSGHKTGLIGTLGNGFPGALDPSANTTPDALALHALLARYVDAGGIACAMEASSIGLDQGRCDGARFHTAVFTNLTRDHLDYHGTMDAYGEAKARLFRWEGLSCVVVNRDDPFSERLLQATGAPRRLSYGLQPPSPQEGVEPLTAQNVRDTTRGLAFDLIWQGRHWPVEAPVIGHYNVSNLLAVAGGLIAYGLSPNQLPALLGALPPPPGRMQRLGGEHAPLVAIDYAHTPDALDNALRALRPTAAARGGRLWCVFGCGGDRDPGKRPEMGAVAERLADRIVLTSDNPRSESPEAILTGIRAGLQRPDLAQVQVDRRQAITDCLALAEAEDVVLVAGKGHEDYQEIRGQRLPYRDDLVVNAALAAWRERHAGSAGGAKASQGVTEKC